VQHSDYLARHIVLVYANISGYLYFLIYAVYMRNYCENEKIDLWILTDSRVHKVHEYEKWFLERNLSVCVCIQYVCMYVLKYVL
jgi:general stress protein 26